MSGGETGHNTDTGTVTCPACGATNAIGARFCERCGTRLPQRANREIALEPSLSGPGDATITFQRPPREIVPGEPGSPSSPPDSPSSRSTVLPEPGETLVFRPESSAPVESSPDASPPLGDARTVTFASPPAPLAPSPPDAATIAFTPPPAGAAGQGAERVAAGAEAEGMEDRPGEMSPTRTPDPSELATSDIATSESASGASPAGQSPTAGATTGGGFAVWTPDVSRGAPLSSSSPGAATHEVDVTAPPAARRDELDAGATLPTMIPPAAPPWPGGPTAGAATSGPMSGRFVPPGADVAPGASGALAPPAGAHPSGAASYPVPQSTGAGPYPAPAAPATGGGNRTLWIILGVAGALVLLCAIACIGIFVIGAVSASATTNAVATGVATVTRP